MTPKGDLVESQGPLAILWVGIGLCCFYIALVWLNTLLGFFLTPLFIIPQTWLMDMIKERREKRGEKRVA
jgi:Flp pilus assembly protein TadB